MIASTRFLNKVALGICFILPQFAIHSANASVDPAMSTAPSQPKWMLKSFLHLSLTNPARLLRLADKLFASERLRITSLEPNLAYEWQHRLAMASALSDFFDPKSHGGKQFNAQLKMHARKILNQALSEDPSLLVRDGCVESIRRIIRMQPGERKIWKAPLEESFLDPKNSLQGEGFFIRETILTALREASLQPSTRVRRAAMVDKNVQVRALLKNFRTQAYDSL